MTQPTPYRPSYDFGDAGTALPPGVPLDAELLNIRRTFDEILRNLSLIQRDDTRLRNGIVGIDTLDQRALALISAGTFRVAGDWEVGKELRAGDFVTVGGAVYLAMSDHVASAIDVDLLSGDLVRAFEPELSKLYGVGLATATKTQLLALAGPFPEAASAAVHADGTLANRGIYSYVAGVWTKIADLPSVSAQQWAEAAISAVQAAAALANSYAQAAGNAAAVATAMANLKPDTSTGLATTAEGGYFAVIDPANPAWATIYRKVGGVAVSIAIIDLQKMGYVEVTAAPYYFGKSGNTASQNATALQQAVNDAVAAFKATSMPWTLTFFGLTATVSIDKAIIVADWNGSSFASSVTVHFLGRKAYNADIGPDIKQTNNNQPAMIFQRTRACEVRGLNFTGTITGSPTWTQLTAPDNASTSWWATGGRYNVWSPSGGIMVDPFSSGISSGDQYPGLEPYYVSSSGSNTLFIRDCSFTNMIVAVGWSMSFTNQGDGNVLADCRFMRCKTVLAIGRDQARMCMFTDNFINICGTIVDCLSHGNGIGQMPIWRGGQVTIAREMFMGNGARYNGSIVQVDTESLWRIGYWGTGGTISLTACNIKLALPSDGTSGYAPDVHLHAAGNVVFYACRIWTNDNQINALNFFVSSRVALYDCQLDGEISYTDGTGGVILPAIDYHNCSLNNATAGERYGISMEVYGTQSDATRRQMMLPVGGRFIEIGSADRSIFREWTCLGNPNITLDSAVAVTANGTGGASFTSADVAKYQVGEYIHTDTAVTGIGFGLSALGAVSLGGHLSIGRVASIVGSVVTLDNVAQRIVSGNYNIKLARLGIVRPRMMITLTSGSPNATLSAAVGFVAGDRLRGRGIPVGAWITSKGTTDVVLSHNATESGTFEVYDSTVELTKARQSLTQGIPSGTWFKGDSFTIFGFDVTQAAQDSPAASYVCVKSGATPSFVTLGRGRINQAVTASFTLGLTHAFQTVEANHATVPIVVTVPEEATVSLPIGYWVDLHGRGAAAVSVVAGSGSVTIQSRGGLLSLNGQYARGRLEKVGTNRWLFSGDRA